MHQVNHSKESVIVKYELCYLSRSTCLTAHVDALVRPEPAEIWRNLPYMDKEVWSHSRCDWTNF